MHRVLLGISINIHLKVNFYKVSKILNNYLLVSMLSLRFKAFVKMENLYLVYFWNISIFFFK